LTQSINHGDRSALGETDPVPHLSAAKRWFSLAELALGSVIVIGHNVYHVIPHEVPILFVIGLISLRLRDGGWSVMVVHWPASCPGPSCTRWPRLPENHPRRTGH